MYIKRFKFYRELFISISVFVSKSKFNYCKLFLISASFIVFIEIQYFEKFNSERKFVEQPCLMKLSAFTQTCRKISTAFYYRN